MKRTLLATIMCLPLAACFGSNSDPVNPSAPPDTTSVWMAVRNFTLAACHYDPDLQTVAQLIAAGTGYDARPLADMICGAVTGPVSKNKAGVVLAPTVRVTTPGGRTAVVSIRGRRL